MNKTQLMKTLEKRYLIQTREFFFPPQIAFARMGLYQDQPFPVATQLSQEGLYLPSGLGNTMTEFKRVVLAIKKIHQHAQRKLH